MYITSWPLDCSLLLSVHLNKWPFYIYFINLTNLWVVFHNFNAESQKRFFISVLFWKFLEQKHCYISRTLLNQHCLQHWFWWSLLRVCMCVCIFQWVFLRIQCEHYINSSPLEPALVGIVCVAQRKRDSSNETVHYMNLSANGCKLGYKQGFH